MARTPSNMIALGSSCPEFELLDTDQQRFSTHQAKGGKGLLVIFMCNHCPFVIHIRPELAKFAQEYQNKGLTIVGINSNDVVAYPQDHPSKMKIEKDLYYSFPYLFDESQQVAKSFHAACTPDFFLYDGDLKLVYRGQFDESRPSNGIAVTGKSLRMACDALLQSGKVDPSLPQHPSLGCNIKWKD